MLSKHPALKNVQVLHELHDIPSGDSRNPTMVCFVRVALSRLACNWKPQGNHHVFLWALYFNMRVTNKTLVPKASTQFHGEIKRADILAGTVPSNRDEI